MEVRYARQRLTAKRNSNGGHIPDTTVADQPDTPAPVFAARAFKSVLFGAQGAPSNPKAPCPSTVALDVKDTPSKPPGILLTPGTGTTRRKRVSFGHDVGDQVGGP